MFGFRPSPLDVAADEPITHGPSGARVVRAVEKPQIHQTRLPNGVRVISEEARLPGLATIGLAADFGTRDESPQCSGTLHSMSLTRYKSMLNTVDTVNYGMVQMSGGDYRMGYDREKAWWKTQCLAHDAVDLFSMMADCAFEPRTHTTCNNAIGRLADSHRYHNATQSHNAFTELVMSSVFGQAGLGNSLLGVEANALNLNPNVVQSFQRDNISPEGIVVVGLNVENHLEFEELVASKLAGFVAQRTRVRQPSVFKPSRVVIPKRANSVDLAVLFPTSCWSDPQLPMNYILAAALGRAETNYRDPLGLSLSRGLLTRDLYLAHTLFKSVEAFNMHFTDAGVFGLRASVAPGHENKALEMLAAAVRRVDRAAFHAAQNLVLVEAQKNLNNEFARVEEYLKEGVVFGEITAQQFLEGVRSARFEDFEPFLAKLLQSEPAVVVQGPDLSSLMAQGKIASLFK